MHQPYDHPVGHRRKIWHCATKTIDRGLGANGRKPGLARLGASLGNGGKCPALAAAKIAPRLQLRANSGLIAKTPKGRAA